MLAWKSGCKGLTVYVTGSRDKVVLETKATAEAKGRKNGAAPAVEGAAAVDAPPVTPPDAIEAFPPLKRRPRPSACEASRIARRRRSAPPT